MGTVHVKLCGRSAGTSRGVEGYAGWEEVCKECGGATTLKRNSREHGHGERAMNETQVMDNGGSRRVCYTNAVALGSSESTCANRGMKIDVFEEQVAYLV
jgi:hypothetical protein